MCRSRPARRFLCWAARRAHVELMAKEEVFCPKLQMRFEHFGDCNAHAVSCRFAPASIPRHLCYRAMGLWRNKRRSAPPRWERASHRRTLRTGSLDNTILFFLRMRLLQMRQYCPCVRVHLSIIWRGRLG